MLSIKQKWIKEKIPFKITIYKPTVPKIKLKSMWNGKD